MFEPKYKTVTPDHHGSSIELLRRPLNRPMPSKDVVHRLGSVRFDRFEGRLARTRLSASSELVEVFSARAEVLCGLC